MEASDQTAAQTLTPEPDTVAPEQSTAEKRNTDELFKYSDWVHVGPGAEECADAMNGKCANPMHFHAWVRLPNQFQHQSITDKANAAKARKIRAFRDADSDESAILDGQLEEIENSMGADEARNAYVEEIVFKDYMRDYFMAVQEMKSEEGEEDEPGPWATIDEDQERLAALQAMPPDERPEGEYSELQSRLASYKEEVERRVKEEKQQPVRESLQQRSLDELRVMVREDRVQKTAMAAYMQTYTLWEQYIGTMKPQEQGMPSGKPGIAHERYFKSIDHLKAAAPEVVKALDDVFTGLDGEFGKRFVGPEGLGKV